MNIFVIMPFDTEFNSVYQDIIKATLEAENHSVKRADDASTHQNILKGVIQDISDADLVIADLTTQNANVFYELGIAHSLRTPTIQIAQSMDDVPFDLRSYRVITYSEHHVAAKKLSGDILELVRRKESDDYTFSNPVMDTLGSEIRSDSRIANSAAPDASGEEEVEISDASDMGMLDGVVEAEESVEQIGELGLEIAEQFGNLSEKIQAHTDKINRLNLSPNQKGLNSKRLQVARQFASDLNEFSENIKDTIPRMHSSWETVDQGLGLFFSFNEIKDNEERDAIKSLADGIDTTRNGLKENRIVFDSFRNSQDQLLGLSRATDRALSSSDRTLQKLNDEFELGESVLSRMIDLANDMIDRYLISLDDHDDIGSPAPE